MTSDVQGQYLSTGKSFFVASTLCVSHSAAISQAHSRFRRESQDGRNHYVHGNTLARKPGPRKYLHVAFTVPARSLVPTGIVASASNCCDTCKQLDEASCDGGEGIFEWYSACDNGCVSTSVPTREVPHTMTYPKPPTHLRRRLRRRERSRTSPSSILSQNPSTGTSHLFPPCHSVLFQFFFSGSVELPRIWLNCMPHAAILAWRRADHLCLRLRWRGQQPHLCQLMDRSSPSSIL